MVLVSETLTVVTAVLATAAILRANLLAFLFRSGQRVRQSGSYAFLMLVSYGAVRLLLEVEPKQAVGPVYIAAISLTYYTLPYGKWRVLDWYLRILNASVCLLIIILFLALAGLNGIETIAKSVKLDREVTWYQVVFANISSFRWLFVLLVSCIHSKKRKVLCKLQVKYVNIVYLPFRIAVVWILLKGTGRAVAPSPWGIYDEILLESTNLLHLILVLLSITMCTDHVSDYFHEVVEDEDAETMDWEDFIEYNRSKLKCWVENRASTQNSAEESQSDEA